MAKVFLGRAVFYTTESIIPNQAYIDSTIKLLSFNNYFEYDEDAKFGKFKFIIIYPDKISLINTNLDIKDIFINDSEYYISIYNNIRVSISNRPKRDKTMAYWCIYDNAGINKNNENKKRTRVIRLCVSQDTLNKKIDIIENHGGKIKDIKTEFNNDHKAVGIFYIDAIITYQAKEPNFSEINKLLDIK